MSVSRQRKRIKHFETSGIAGKAIAQMKINRILGERT